MSKRSVLIVDDEENPRNLIREYLSNYKDMTIIGECHNGIEAIKYINMLEPDLVFLDIQMPGANGFQVLQEIDYIPMVIFTTAYDQYAVKAFEHSAVDYLLKPYTRERFDNAILKLNRTEAQAGIRALTENVLAQENIYPGRILVEKGKRLKSLDISEIIYLKAEKDYTQIFTADDSYLSIYGIGTVEQKLNPQTFIRVHRSFIININHITELYRDITKTFIVMGTGIEIAVGRKYLPAIKRLIF